MHPMLLKPLPKAGRELVVKEFSLEKVIAETMEIYAHQTNPKSDKTVKNIF
jgi:hypothetical protein